MLSHDTNTLGKETYYFSEIMKGNVNPNDFIGIKESKIGKKLISDGFGPCQAVLAILKNDQYAVYHAYTMTCNDSFQNFVNLIKNNVESLIVFQKSMPPKNLEKAPYLAINLARELDCQVKRIQVEDYSGIYANADRKEIILFRDSDFTSITEDTTLFFESEPIAIKPIGIKKSVVELYEIHKHNYQLDDNGINMPNVQIPKKFIPQSILNDIGFFNHQQKNQSIHFKERDHHKTPKK